MTSQREYPKVSNRSAGLHLHNYREVWKTTDNGYQLINRIGKPSEDFEDKCQRYADKHYVTVIAAGLGGAVEYHPGHRHAPATEKQKRYLRRFEAKNLPVKMTRHEASRRIDYWYETAKANAKKARISRRDRLRSRHS